MPQLDSVVFISSVIWLIVIFFIFYTLYLQFVLPKLMFIIKLRNKKISKLETATSGMGLVQDYLVFKYSDVINYYFKVETEFLKSNVIYEQV